MSEKLKGLYVISDDVLTPKNTILFQIETAFKAGAKIVQLRDKISQDEEIENLVLNLQTLCRKYNALFVLNDRIDLAIKLSCDGLHIGKSDYDKVSQIREKFKGVLGISCYGDIKTAKKMQDLKVDYVAFGSFFTSPTKPNAAVVSKDVISQAKKELNIPVCTIGGITSENAHELVNKGCDMVAVISDIFKSDDIFNQCKKYIDILKAKK